MIAATLPSCAASLARRSARSIAPSPPHATTTTRTPASTALAPLLRGAVQRHVPVRRPPPGAEQRGLAVVGAEGRVGEVCGRAPQSWRERVRHVLGLRWWSEFTGPPIANEGAGHVAQVGRGGGLVA